MKNRFLILTIYSLVVLFVSGCAMVDSRALKGSSRVKKGIDWKDYLQDNSLWTVRISRLGSVRFTGLMAVTRESDQVNYFLLDTTGVTLLKVQGLAPGNDNKEVVTGILRESGLHELLSECLGRVFLSEPQDYPCEDMGFYTFCRQVMTSTEELKEMAFGPFAYWRVARTVKPEDDISDKNTNKNNNRVVGNAVVYSYLVPWLDLTIQLSPTR